MKKSHALLVALCLLQMAMPVQADFVFRQPIPGLKSNLSVPDPLPGQPPFTGTAILMHMDEHPLKDEAGNSVTENGVQLSSDIKAFGTGSVLFASGGYVDVQTGVKTSLNGDFTIEGGVSPQSLDSWGTLWELGNQTTGLSLSLKSDWIELWVAGMRASLAVALQNGDWYHIAVTRQSGMVFIFVNGFQLGMGFPQPASLSGNVRLGAGVEAIGLSPFSGVIDEFRVLNGTSAYTSTFTPPTAPFELQ